MLSSKDKTEVSLVKCHLAALEKTIQEIYAKQGIDQETMDEENTTPTVDQYNSFKASCTLNEKEFGVSDQQPTSNVNKECQIFLDDSINGGDVLVAIGGAYMECVPTIPLVKSRAKECIDQWFSFISPTIVSPVKQKVDPRKHWNLADFDPWDNSIMALNDWKILKVKGIRMRYNYETLIDTPQCPLQEVCTNGGSLEFLSSKSNPPPIVPRIPGRVPMAGVLFVAVGHASETSTLISPLPRSFPFSAKKPMESTAMVSLKMLARKSGVKSKENNSVVAKGKSDGPSSDGKGIVSLLVRNAHELGNSRAFDKLWMMIRRLWSRRGILVLLWCKEWDVEFKSFSSAHVDVFASCEGKIWCFMSFYGNSTRSQCHHSWELIRRLKGLFILPWIVPGNFNEIVHLSEKLGGNDRVHSDMRRFSETINDCELRDLGFFGAAMTWNNGQDPPSIQVVLHFGNYNMDRGDNSVRRFTFEPIWLSKPEYKKVVLNSWWQTVVCGDDSLLAENLDACASAVKSCSKEVFSNIPRKIASLQKKKMGSPVL
ncbi:hypothetical protein TIFTF001_039458 [Ficus carica]|uniref:Uncharacterized protein n=1 Tax=Ficus carica TaxID=3494 RepID=A0AA88JE46_FICCA|nr:hypothetical protein TIFTF001_039458 [Ficus carica]